MSKPIFDRNAEVLVVEQVGRTRTLTPEGFLFCEGVRIARTGPMIYTPDEMPGIELGPASMIVVERDAPVLFDLECVASFNGKPVTNGHPDQMVSPETWRADSVGIVLNPRRGEGVESEYLLADLLITDADAIKAVNGGLLEVSCGYDSDREQVKPGLARITKVIGNHVALVEKGRCGPACAINDHEGKSMASKRTTWDRLRTAFRAKDEAAFEAEMNEAQAMNDDGEGEPSPPVVVHVHNAPGAKPDVETPAPAKDEGEADPLVPIAAAIEKINGRLDALEKGGKPDAESAPAKDEEPKPEGEADKREPVMDSAALRDEFQDVIARAEILAPGIKLPVFDSAKGCKFTADAMCDLRRRALEGALGDAVRKPSVTAVLGDNPNIKAMTCDAATMAFRAASELARVANNRPSNTPHNVMGGGKMTPAKLQELNAARRKAGA